MNLQNSSGSSDFKIEYVINASSLQPYMGSPLLTVVSSNQIDDGQTYLKKSGKGFKM